MSNMNALMYVILGMILGGVASVAWYRHFGTREPMRTDIKPADPVLPVDTHLVLNVLNRLAIQITDEHLQDGLEALGQYLAANARDMKEGGIPPGELGLSLESYWRLTEWQHRKAAAVWQQLGPWPENTHQRAALLGRLLSALQAIERVGADRVELMANGPWSAGERREAQCTVYISSKEMPHIAPPQGWRLAENSALQFNVTWNHDIAS
ncbi:hypothetical protein [Ideonella paludis]|uniref:Uncharacterized protein n=1 Tax=Ideonella paludis TaxID=1233411 RepID=A0ABS5E2Z5_9BURK|nr:hypothetical protein [Ideonella paludis]MBQ0937790.1 hypothetical protein [Ideonella paludis]